MGLFGDDGIPEGEGPGEKGLPRVNRKGGKIYNPRIRGVGNVKGEDEPEEVNIEYVNL